MKKTIASTTSTSAKTKRIREGRSIAIMAMHETGYSKQEICEALSLSMPQVSGTIARISKAASWG
jgi:hypothetical protein